MYYMIHLIFITVITIPCQEALACIMSHLVVVVDLSLRQCNGHIHKTQIFGFHIMSSVLITG